jgi:hypothetical protein
MKRYGDDFLSMFWTNIEHGKAVMSEFCKSDDDDDDDDDDCNCLKNFIVDNMAEGGSYDEEEQEADVEHDNKDDDVEIEKEDIVNAGHFQSC